MIAIKRSIIIALNCNDNLFLTCPTTHSTASYGLAILTIWSVREVFILFRAQPPKVKHSQGIKPINLPGSDNQTTPPACLFYYGFRHKYMMFFYSKWTNNVLLLIPHIC